MSVISNTCCPCCFGVQYSIYKKCRNCKTIFQKRIEVDGETREEEFTSSNSLDIEFEEWKLRKDCKQSPRKKIFWKWINEVKREKELPKGKHMKYTLRDLEFIRKLPVSKRQKIPALKFTFPKDLDHEDKDFRGSKEGNINLGFHTEEDPELNEQSSLF